MDPGIPSQETVPVPWRERLKEYRYSFLPPLTFLATLAAAGFLWSAYIVPDAVPGVVHPEMTDTLSEGCNNSSDDCSSSNKSCCDSDPIDP